MTAIAIKDIRPNPDQPRSVFDKDELAGLAQSIKENGLIQPIVVEKRGARFILVDGERRLRACKLLGQKRISAVVRPPSNHRGQDLLAHAMVANLQRSDMGAVDKARAFRKLTDRFGTQQAVAEKLGISGQLVSVYLTLLDLALPVQKLFNLGRIPVDPTIIFSLNKLPAEQQLEVASIGTTRGWATKAWRLMVGRMIKDGRIKVKAPGRPGPVKKEIKIEAGGHFDALALVDGWKKLPAQIVQTARKTCKACSLYAEAGPAICRQCPLPDFLRRLKEETA